MARYAVIDNGTGLVCNVVSWDGVTTWEQGENYNVVQSDTLQIGQYIEGFTAPQEKIASAKAERIAQIKAVAQERIYAIALPWKQSNLLARSIELRDIKDERAWTEEEAAEDVANKAIWATVKAIRAASNEAELAVNAAATIQEINSVEF